MPPLGEETPDLAEVVLREEIAKEIHAEYAARSIAESNDQRDKRFLALGISGCGAVSLLLVVVIPALGLLLGAAVKLFFWASGLR